MGASTDAINAILVGLNYSEKKIGSILFKLDFNNFIDNSNEIFRYTVRLIEEYGWFKGDFFRKWIGYTYEEGGQ